jgi:hypothetical protein
MKTLITMLAAALLGMGGWLMYEIGLHAAPTPSPLRVAAPTPLPPPAAPHVSMRAQIRQAIETDVAPLHSEGDVDRYLGDLEARARRNGRVTALELEPGIRAIQRLADELGHERADEKLAAFAQKMTRLAAEVDGRERPAPPPDLDDLARRIERASGAERDTLVRRYQEATHTLPADEKLRELERLGRLIAAR